MEDIGAPPYESTAVEVWIQRELKNRKQADYVADQLLKQWDQGRLSFSGKKSAGIFCVQNGFYASLIRVLRKDLLTGLPLPWNHIFRILFHFEKKIPKELADACLTGASRDKQLQELAAEAVRLKDPDPRWSKILSAELKDRLYDAQQGRKRLLEDLKIFRNEGMDTEVREGVTRLLAVFPEDPEGKTFALHMNDRDVDRTLQKMRQTYNPRQFPIPLEDRVDWPELKAALLKQKKKFDTETSYVFSIGLHEMGLHDSALEVLRWAKSKWTIREEMWELELLIHLNRFAEALSSSQIILRRNTEVEVVRSALYFSAKAYHGLDDTEQASSILKGILEHDPHYRDAAVLLIEWGDRHR